MIQTIVLLVIIISCVALIFFMTRKVVVKYQESNCAYSAKNDKEAQKAYIDSRKKPSSLIISIKDKLELSWQFLYDITNIVLNKFSKADKDETLAMGHIMLEHGGRYEHVVDYGIRQESTARDPNISKEQVR